MNLDAEVRTPVSPRPAAGQPPLPYACPRCRSPLTPAPEALVCSSCAVSYKVIAGIPTFTDDARYWGEIPEEDMSRLVAEVEAGRPWREVILEARESSVRDKSRFLLDPRRATWALDLALPESAEILDIGAGLGGVSAALAPHASRVVALEPVELRARFAAARFTQDGLAHVQVVRGTALDLPFLPASFDLVVLSGVLEWLGKGARDPAATQRAALERVAEVLRPEGTVVVGIENRIGVWFFLGRQDHSYLPFTSLIPRWLANAVTHLLRGQPYDTLTYTHSAYRRLFAVAGLCEVRTILPIWSYNCPDYLVPLDPEPRADMLALLMTASGRRARWPALRRVHAALRLSRLLANDFIFFARRYPEPDHGWLEQMVRERWSSWGLAGSPDRMSFLIHNRSHPTIIAYARGEPGGRVVIRVSPLSFSFSPPRAEVEALRWLTGWLHGALSGSVPEALDLLEHGAHAYGVTTYMPGLPPLLPQGGPRSAKLVRAAGAVIASALGWLEAFHRRIEPRGPQNAPFLSGDDIATWVRPGLAAALPDGPMLADRIQARLAPIGSLGRVVRSPQHGDFVLSNLRLDDGRVGVIDWERFGRVPLPGFDAVHFVTYIALLIQPDPWNRPLDPQAVVGSIFDQGRLGNTLRAPLARYLSAQGIPAELFPRLFPSYLAAFIGEYGGDPGRRGIVTAMADLLRVALEESDAALEMPGAKLL